MLCILNCDVNCYGVCTSVHGAADYVDPASGSLIADFEGTVNVTTITCNITDGVQIGTLWSIQNFRNNPNLQFISDQLMGPFYIGGDPRPIGTSTFTNRLTVLTLSSELDGVMVYCGSGQNRQQANFYFRVYRKFT